MTQVQTGKLFDEIDPEESRAAMAELASDDDLEESQTQGLREISFSNRQDEDGDALDDVDHASDYSEFIQRLHVLVQQTEGIDMRSSLIESFAKFNEVEELDFGDIAAVISFGLVIRCCRNEMISYRYPSQTAPILRTLSKTETGKRLIGRISAVYSRLIREEPALVRAIKWEIVQVRERASLASKSSVSNKYHPEDEFDPSVVSRDEIGETSDPFAAAADPTEIHGDDFHHESELSSDPHPKLDAIVRLETSNPREAGRMLVQLTQPNVSRAIVREVPERILALIQSGDDELGITPQQSGHIVDMLVGEHTDARASELLRGHLSEERTAEVIAARGDQSIAMHVVTQAALIKGIALSVRQSLDMDHQEPRAYELFVTMAHEATSRSDWQDVLDVEVGHHVFGDYLLVALVITQLPEIPAGFLGIGSPADDDEDDDSIPVESDTDDEGDTILDDDEEEDERDHFARCLSSFRLNRATVSKISPQVFQDFGFDSQTAVDQLLSLFPSDLSSDLTMTCFVLYAASLETSSVSTSDDESSPAVSSSDEAKAAATEAAESLF